MGLTVGRRSPLAPVIPLRSPPDPLTSLCSDLHHGVPAHLATAPARASKAMEDGLMPETLATTMDSLEPAGTGGTAAEHAHSTSNEETTRELAYLARDKDPAPHPLAQLLPEREGKSYAALLANVRHAGRLHRPISLYQGQILDGRARLRACREAQVEPRYSDFAGSDEDAVAFIASENLTARQLKPSQRAICAARLWQASEQARKSANLQKMTQAQASELMQVSLRHLLTATLILDDEYLCAVVMSGKTSLAAAVAKLDSATVTAKAGAPSSKRKIVGRLMSMLVELQAADVTVDDLIAVIPNATPDEQYYDIEQVHLLLGAVLNDPRLHRKLDTALSPLGSCKAGPTVSHL